jgi:cytochrome c biogenesis protein CcdA
MNIISSLQNVLINGSLPIVLMAVALAGMVASLSSCTITRLPVVLSYVAGAAESRKKTILLSIAFSCGLIASYTLLGFSFGVISNLAGKLIQLSRYIYFILGALLFIMGILFAGLIPAKMGWLNKRCNEAAMHTKNYPSAFIFGFLFAFLEMPACPCCGAVLMVIASLVVIKGSILYSAFVFLFFAIGQSLPVILIGFSAGFLKNLASKTTHLEEHIKFFAGNVLIVFGIFLMMLS